MSKEQGDLPDKDAPNEVSFLYTTPLCFNRFHGCWVVPGGDISFLLPPPFFFPLLPLSASSKSIGKQRLTLLDLIFALAFMQSISERIEV